MLRFYLSRVHLLLLVVYRLKRTVLGEILLFFDLVLLFQLLDRSLVELQVVALLLYLYLKALNLYGHVVFLCLQLVVNAVLVDYGFLELCDHLSIVLYSSLVLFNLEIYGIQLYMQSINLFSLLIDLHFPILDFLFPLLIILGMILNLLIQLIFSLLQYNFKFSQFLLQFRNMILLILYGIQIILNLILNLFLTSLQLRYYPLIIILLLFNIILMHLLHLRYLRLILVLFSDQPLH